MAEDLSRFTTYIAKYLGCSTAHVTGADNELLGEDSQDPDNGLRVGDLKDCGWTVYVPLASQEAIQEQAERIGSRGYSAAFATPLELARKLECEYVWLSTDREEIDGLPTFIW